MLRIKQLYWKWLYRNIDKKVAYEVVKDPKDSKLMYLYGPILPDTIRLAAPKYKQTTGFEFVQVVNGRITGAFKKNEIIFVDEVL